MLILMILIATLVILIGVFSIIAKVSFGLMENILHAIIRIIALVILIVLIVLSIVLFIEILI